MGSVTGGSWAYIAHGREPYMMPKLVCQVLALVVAVGMIGVSSPGHAQETSGSPVLVNWTAPASLARLARSAHKVDFFPLSNHFVGQDNKIFCGPTSVAIVLNALRPRDPDAPLTTHSLTPDDRAWMRPGSNPFLRKYTPHNVLTEQTKTRLEVLGKPIVIQGKQQRDFGLQLRQLAQVFRAHGLAVTTRVVDDQADAAQITREIARNLATADNFVVINYKRRALGQPGGGHISPLGAYDADSDSFLILDVNPTRAPWVWVRAADLIAAMRTFDTVENRGYLLVSEN